MRLLRYLHGDRNLSYRSSPHTEFNPTALVSESFGEFLIANDTLRDGRPMYAWDEPGEQIDPAPLAAPRKARKVSA